MGEGLAQGRQLGPSYLSQGCPGTRSPWPYLTWAAIARERAGLCVRHDDMDGPEGVTQGEVSQSQEDTFCRMPFCEKSKIIN